MTPRSILILVVAAGAVVLCAAQNRRRSSPAKPAQAAKVAATKYSSFLHASERHKGLECKACHKIPTVWTAKREFPDVADFPDHDSCVRCHRPQFFTRQAFSGAGPAICTVCHVRNAPREDARFAFGKPNHSNQTFKAKEERQFTIEFPHDKHQNVIASFRRSSADSGIRFAKTSFRIATDEKKPDYNNCSLCHATYKNAANVAVPGGDEVALLPGNAFKTTPHSHDACFNCHWKNEKPSAADCAGCHKPAVMFEYAELRARISAKFSHEGGKGEHVMECTSCHINITRAASLRGLTPDVPIAACATCHKDSKKTTYPKAVTIEEEFEQNKRTGVCTYCHTTDVGKRKAPASHEAAAQ